MCKFFATPEEHDEIDKKNIVLFNIEYKHVFKVNVTSFYLNFKYK